MRVYFDHILFALIMCFVTSIHAQNHVISGKVVDASTHEPIVFGAIMVKGTQLSSQTGSNGEFLIDAPNKKVTLVVFQFGYFTKEYDVEVDHNENNEIGLFRKLFELNEVTVTSKKTDTLQANNHTTFLAFEFYDNFIVSLVNKGSSYNTIQLLNESGAIIKEHKAPLGVKELFKDCFGNVQLLSKDSSYQFYYDYESILFPKAYSLTTFLQLLKPCQCLVGNNYYFKEITYKNLRNTYFMINKNDFSKRRLFAQVYNTEAITAFNFDYDINYFLAQRRKGDNSYATSVNQIKEHIEEYRDRLILSQKYLMKLNPIKSDLIKRDSSLLVIDYTHKLIYKHNFLGGLLKTDSIFIKGLSPLVLQDFDLNTLYFIKETNGTLNLFEYKESGIKEKAIRIEDFKFIKNVRCRNNTLYFLNVNKLNNEMYTKIYSYKL